MLPSNVYSAASLSLIGRTTDKRVKIGKYNVPIGMLFTLPTEAMNDWHSLDSDYEPRFGLLCAAEGCVVGLTLAHTPEAPHAYVITPDEAILIAAAHGWTTPLPMPVPENPSPDEPVECNDPPVSEVNVVQKPTESSSVEASNTAPSKARVRKPSPRKAPVEKPKAQDKSPKGRVAKAPARVALPRVGGEKTYRRLTYNGKSP